MGFPISYWSLKFPISGFLDSMLDRHAATFEVLHIEGRYGPISLLQGCKINVAKSEHVPVSHMDRLWKPGSRFYPLLKPL